jgi:hypothetical protein
MASPTLDSVSYWPRVEEGAASHPCHDEHLGLVGSKHFGYLNNGHPSCNEHSGSDLDSIKSLPSILFSMEGILFRAYPSLI